MRPLRLLLDGFGCYREPTEADFSDVNFFALVGPTGSGKSTVIDGLCFALYGTVPRWGKENVIAQALAPAANSCRVCLVFETAGKRYGAVRALSRDRRGQVHTKEARLELLDSGVQADAPIEEILAASVRQLAEGPDEVKAGVQEILGLTYDHFTQSVLLPQGRFSEFLHAKASDRQGLLVELLAFGVYGQVGQRARARAQLSAERGRLAQAERDQLPDATEEAETQAAARVSELRGLTEEVRHRLISLRELDNQADQATRRASEARAEVTLLDSVRVPEDVPDLARKIADADRQMTECRERRDAADGALDTAQQARNSLGDKTSLELFSQAYTDRGELAAQLEQQRLSLAQAQRAEARQDQELEDAERLLQDARDELVRVERAHAAVHLAESLRVGEKCPVCLQPVTELPHHPAPADLAEAKAAVTTAEHRVSEHASAQRKASRTTAAASEKAQGTVNRIDDLTSTLIKAPDESVVLTTLAAIIDAEAELQRAQVEARNRRADFSAAERKREALTTEEQQSRARLHSIRDSVVHLGAPAVADGDLATAWDALVTWALSQHAERSGRQPELDEAADSLQRQVAEARDTVAQLLKDHGIADVADPLGAAAAIATHQERAANRLREVQDNRRKAAELAEQIRQHHDDEMVAMELGRLLRATSFERWLCGEALDSLVAEASRTLLELSGGQYELDRDERNDLVVIDYQDAGASRPVHTLSGGETFQASLALALALSQQVIGLSAGMRDLNSMFLDEGFGTLDEDTLETVATTLERLATDSDRMVGIITHVSALAERVPVRFVVSRAGSTATLRKERT